MLEEDSETDGYLSEDEDKSQDIFGTPMGAAIFTMKQNNSLKKIEQMQLEQLDELLDSSLKQGPSMKSDDFKTVSIERAQEDSKEMVATGAANNKTAK
mmetsp:Transcript_41304/g.62909  ORF Transcript_41304/g.62909 Transcript_41304/m.62909 type:complete len:98 (-) Transcript_41304:2861-3154(-)